MDSEFSQGSVLVCNPTSSISNPMDYGVTSGIAVPNSVKESTKQTKKRRHKSKQKKENHEDLLIALQKEIGELSFMPLADKANVTLDNTKVPTEPTEGASADPPPKPRTRYRRKKENKEGNSSKDGGEESLKAGDEAFIGNKTINGPYFADNRKVPKEYFKEISKLLECDKRNVAEEPFQVVETGDDILDFMAALRVSPLPQSKKKRRHKKTAGTKGGAAKAKVDTVDSLVFTRSENGNQEKSAASVNDETLLKVQEEIKKLQMKFRSEGRQNEPFFKDKKKNSSSKQCKPKKSSLPSGGTFPPYLTAEEVEVGLANKTMLAGAIRINARNYKEAYISSEGCEKDVVIEGLKDRNRALDADEVVVLINPQESWKVNSGQRTGKVVYIQEQVHMRRCVGRLPADVKPDNTFVVFSPRDSRVPRIRLSLSDPLLPPDYFRNPKLYSESLFQAEIIAWNDVTFAEGRLMGLVGPCGDVESETLAILLENNLDPNPINPLLNMFFPQSPYKIPQDEIAKRRDLRKDCVFTIDPATARDLDDAVSARVLDNGHTLVGVHISDVAHFLSPDTLLDQTVQRRATTVYLVQRVYHMLPVELCQLCSLTPGQDKLAFSVFLELDAGANIVSHHFTRSVIHSCVQLSYEHAQMVIDNPEKKFSSDDFPAIVNGFSAEDCAGVIRRLYSLSQVLRRRRFDTGALRIDMPKLCFHLHTDMQTPLSSFIYENKESHRLIEEFMLLANITVAEHLYRTYPDLAFLRQHSPPRANMIYDLQKRLELYGINLNPDCAGSLHTSLVKYSSPVCEGDEEHAWARHIVLNNLCAKPMMRAMYFCPRGDNVCDTSHYALNVPVYTHFTSPIRRYADVVVHRLLAASLGLAPPPGYSHKTTTRIANICNRQKTAAKLAGEQSSLVFLSLLLTEPVESSAAVFDVKDHSMDVVLKQFGVVIRVYTDNLKDKAKVEFRCEDQMPQLLIQWKGVARVQCVQLFTIVRVLVHRASEGLKIAGTLLPPTE